MRKFAATLAALVVVPMIVAAAPAQQAPPDGITYELEVAKGETGTVEDTTSPETGGTNQPNGADHATCGTDQQNRCDRVLVKFTGSGDAAFDFVGAMPIADYDLTIYASDKDGTVGEELASSGNFWFPVDAGCDPVGFVGCGMTGENAATTVKANAYYLVVIDYWFAGGGYTLDVSLA